MMVVRGLVATAVGVPPNVPLDVEDTLSGPLPVDPVSTDITALIADAEAKNPVLAASRAQLAKAQSHLRNIKSGGYPFISSHFRGDELSQSGEWHDNYTASLNLTIPLFTGFSYSNDVVQAQEQLKAAEQQVEEVRQQKALSVWSDYNNFKTAGERIKTSNDLLASATQSHEVALGRYKEGVGSILDLLTAHRTLAEARAFEIQAKADWLISLAQLKKDIGVLEAGSIVTTAEVEQK